MAITPVVPYKKIEESKLQDYLEVLRKGNTMLKELAQMLGIKPRKLRKQIFKKDFRIEHFCHLPDFQFNFFKSALPCILAVRELEWTMICGFSRLAEKHAHVWSKSGRSFDDCLQDAYIALLSAIYSYTQMKIKFITYAWVAIRNKLSAAAYNDNLLSYSKNVLKLVQIFNNEKTNGTLTDQKVYEKLGFSPKQIKLVERARISVSCESALDLDRTGDRSCDAVDYTANRRGLLNEQPAVSENFEIWDALENAGLSDFERKVVDTYLSPHYGWKEDLASQYINPRTKKRYTRMAISFVLKNALEKIKRAYQEKLAS